MKFSDIDKYVQRIDPQSFYTMLEDGVKKKITGYGATIDKDTSVYFESDYSGKIYVLMTKSKNENKEDECYSWIEKGYDLGAEIEDEYINIKSQKEILAKISHSQEFLQGMISDPYGNKFWYVNNKLHREDGPSIEYVHGNKHWYKNGFLHREDGPAVEYAEGEKHWYKDGKLHREDGPAVERHANQRYRIDQWYLYDEEFSEKEFDAILRYEKIQKSINHNKIISDINKIRENFGEHKKNKLKP